MSECDPVMAIASLPLMVRWWSRPIFLDVVARQIEVAVPAGLLQFVARDHQVAIFADPLPAVVLNAHVHVFFAMDEDLLLPFLSSKRISLKPPPPLELMDLMVLLVWLSGSV